MIKTRIFDFWVRLPAIGASWGSEDAQRTLAGVVNGQVYLSTMERIELGVHGGHPGQISYLIGNE